jgi:predicted metalloprotease with PDZ domain
VCSITIAAAVACAAPKPAISVAVDITDAPRKILRAELSIPVSSGPFTVVYPKWLPGEHGPTGPIDNLTGIAFSANGQTLPWKRDDVDMYAFHLNVPPGVNTIQAKLEFLATAAPTGFSTGASTTANLAMVSWNEFILYPPGEPASDVLVEPSIRLPEGWQFATALTTVSEEGGRVHFRPVSLETLVDSPVLAGRYFKEIPLAEDVSPKHYLDMAADGPEDLKPSSELVAAFSNLVRETGALYKSRHYESYHFLVTLSDSVAHFGLEHHESSDDRVDARTFLDQDSILSSGDLLPHEFTHSWNGKYRRPAGLVTANYQQPMKGELLWVYEGLTQYLGDVLAVRSGIWTGEQYRSYLAASAAFLEHRPGRTWRNLEDTGVSAQTLYAAPDQWDNLRRSVDYYPEGELIWLEVDTLIRKLSHGKRSLNDFCMRFLGEGGNTPPRVVPYRLEEITGCLNEIQRYDWAAFLKERLTSKSPHAPLGGIAGGGYEIEYTDRENEYIRADESSGRGVNAWYSIGLRTEDQTIADVLMGSPAYAAGLGPGMKIVAINGRRATDDLFHQVIRDAKGGGPAMELIVENTGYFKVVKIEYHGGEKYPHLAREPDTRAILDDILKPMTKHLEIKSAE